MSHEPAVLGWDIGGVNIKAVRCGFGIGAPRVQSLIQPFEVQRSLGNLASELVRLADRLGASAGDNHAVTMTAELSQAFRTKGEGVAAVIDALEIGFPSGHLHVYTVEGAFVTPGVARERALSVAASNWAATARWVATRFPTSVLIDVGSTTTDIIPIVDGQVAAIGRTDPDRLRTGELVYTGMLRTPVEAITHEVPLWGSHAGVSAESFALIGDVHLWLRQLQPEAYTCPTPDGRPPSREYAAERLARVVCADREMLGDNDVDVIARAIAEAQVQSIVRALQRIRRQHPEISQAVVTGMGELIAGDAAQATGLEVTLFPYEEGMSSQTTAAAAVAFHLHSWLADLP
jgi:probable H4MPT-linked C1 transfer pathway protein